MDKMISISKAAKILGVTTRTLKRWEETASGLNDSRKELIKMFRQLNEVDIIVIEYTDRLARFGYKYLVSIVTCFSAKLYGARGGKKIRKALKELETERQAEKNESYNKSNAN